MKVKVYKTLSMFLIILLALTSIVNLSPLAFAETQQTFVETFDTYNAANYTKGSFQGNYGVIWKYQDAKGVSNGYDIDGKGMIIRQSDGYSKIYAEAISGGISSFSVDLKKFSDKVDPRTVELWINDVFKGTFTLEQQDPETFPVQTFTVKDINVSGIFKLELRHALRGKHGAEIVIDNITWTSYSPEDDGDPQPLTLEHTPIATADVGNTINIHFSISNNEGVVTSKVYYKHQDEVSFQAILPTYSSGSYSGMIPATEVIEAIQYYIEAADNNTTARHPKEGNHTITIVRPHDPQQPISIAEAIANNRGIATVEGYIIATVTSGPTYYFQEPFTINDKLALADSPDERDASKILPVQLPNTSIRTDLNLKDNPQNLGKKVQITGSLATYFTVAGLKNLSTYSVIEEKEPEEDNEEPETPEAPEEPKESEEPGEPGEPEAPQTPKTPKTPEEPKEPEAPQELEEPEESEENEEEDKNNTEPQHHNREHQDNRKNIGISYEETEKSLAKDAQTTLANPTVVSLTDIENHWAKEPILSLAKKGIISGYPDGNFRPDDPITRGEFITLLVKTLGLNTKTQESPENPFGHWAEAYIAAAATEGIIENAGEMMSIIDDPPSGEEIALFLSRVISLNDDSSYGLLYGREMVSRAEVAVILFNIDVRI